MPAALEFVVIPCREEDFGGLTSYVTTRADMHHRENVTERRAWKGAIDGSALASMMRDAALLAIAERPARYPDTVSVIARVAEGRAPAGFGKVGHKPHYFRRADLDALLNASTSTPGLAAQPHA